MKFKLNKRIITGIAVIVVLAVVGTVGALNGWFGGGATIPQDTFTRGLVGYWNMDESNGSLAKDSSPYGNDGMINDGGAGNPISYWTFDEQTGTTAYDSIGSNNGTISSATWNSSGKIGGALNFDGVDDYVDAGTGLSSITYPLTFEAWVNPNTLIQDGIIVNFDVTNSNSDYAFGISNTSDAIFVGRSTYVYGLNDVSNYLIAGKWSHWSIVFTDTTHIYFYLDGVQQTLSSVYSYYSVDGSKTTIGTRLTGVNPAKYFNGYIDDVKIYNYARTATQIQRDYLETYKSKWTQGKIAGAIQFDGIDDYVSVPDSNSLDVPVFTISTWFKTSDVTHYSPLVAKSSCSSAQPQFHLAIIDSKLYFQARGNGGPGTASLTNNTWYHCVLVFDEVNDYAKLYLNGVLDKTYTNTTLNVINSDNEPMTIGMRYYSSPAIYNYASGYIDDVSLYNRALTAAEVKFHYNRGGPVAYWKFDEGSGTLVSDISGNMNNAVIHGPSLSFDGTDYVDVGSGLSLNFGNSSAFTLTTWFKTTSTARGEIISKFNGGTPYQGYTLAINRTTPGKIDFYTGDVGIAATNFGSGLNDGSWHYVVAVASGNNTVTVYIDGGAGDTRSLNQITSFSSVSLTIGSTATLSYFFNGSIDDPQIYSRALSVDEVRERYRGIFKDDTGLVMHLPFDENTGDTAYDKSTYGNNGNLAGSGTICGTGGACPTWTARTGPTWTTGKYGNALSFDGVDDYIDVGNSNVLNTSTQITISSWIKLNNTTAYQRIFTKRSGQTATLSSYSLELDSTGQKPVFWISDGSNYSALTSSNSLTIGQWYHITGIFDGTQQKIYVNGVLDASQNSTVSIINSTTANACIGRDFGGWPSIYFSGIVDDLRIYPYARTADEIRLDYNAGFSAKFGPSSSDCSANPGSCVTNGLVGYWSMDEGTGQKIKDSSGEGNDGWLGSSTSADTSDPKWTSGKVNGALGFDGSNDYVGAGNASSLNTPNGLTLSAWVKFNSISSTLQTIAYKGGLSGDRSWHLRKSGNTIEFWASSDGSTVTYNNGNTVLSANQWYYIVAIYDGVNIIIYLNGKIDSTPTNLPNIFNSVGKLTIGGIESYIATTSQFNGSIDEVKIYNRALSTEEIKFSYNRGGPVAYWKFDEGSGTTAYDSTDNNNNGTISGATWTTGKYGNALSFDGVDDYVNANSMISMFESNTSWTMSTWFKANDVAIRGIIGTFNYYYFYARNDGSIRFIVRNDAGIDSSIYSPVNTYAIGEWHHLAGTFDNSNDIINFYIDGKYVGNSTISGNVRQGATSFSIGYNGNTYFNGTIDDVRIYNYARSVDEIKQDYNLGLAAKLGGGTDCNNDPGSCMTNGLVGYWGFEENIGTTAVDSSGNNNTGTLTNGPKWTQGKASGALIFDGVDDYVSLADSSNWNFGNGDFSMNFLVKFNSLPASSSSQTIFSQVQDNDNRYHLALYNLSGVQTWRFYVRTGATLRLDFTAAPTLTTGTWYNVTLIRSGNNWYWYQNGVQVATTNTAVTMPDLPSVAYIGGYGGASLLFNGVLDNFRVYNRALSVEEVRYQYNKGGPVSQWKFDEGEGITAYDSTDNNNDGVLTNSPTWVEGKSGSALSFDGVNDYVISSNTAIPLGNYSRSVFTWINLVGTADYEGLVSWGAWGSPTSSADFGVDRTTYKLTISDKGSGIIVASPSSLPLNQWVYVGYTYDGLTNTAKLYINGQNVASGIFATPFNTLNSSVFIGRYFNGYYFHGLIDDVRIYNYTRTSTQILQDYNSGFSTYLK